MNPVTRARPGHWVEQKPFVMPTAEEIAMADEFHDMARANRWMPVLVVLIVLPLLVAAVVHLLFR